MGSVRESLVVSNISVTADGHNGSFMSAMMAEGQLNRSSGPGDLGNTASSTLSPPGQAEFPAHLFRPAASSLQKFAMPVVLSAGVLGGLALVTVFTRTPLRRSALANYLTAAGVTNTVYLLCSGVHWVTLHQGWPVQNVTGVCQLTMFALHLSKFLATWYLILAHLERFIHQFSGRPPSAGQVGAPRAWQDSAAGGEAALLSPRVRKWCGMFRAKCIIIVVFIFSMVGFLHYIWTYMVIGGICMIMQESLKHIVRLHKVEIFASIFLPVLLIIVIDAALLGQMLHRLSVRLMRRASSPPRGPGLPALAHQAHQRRRVARSPSIGKSGETEIDLSHEQGRATGVVVLEGVLFAAVLLPFSVMAIRSQFRMPTQRDIEVQTLIEELVKVNAAVKFFLYFVMLRSFRRGFLYLVCCCCRRGGDQQGESLQETSV
ncbi:hypothetical protein EGW08_008295 [Elysia chlorotica]|uniref:G-protein coupled receptors family 1 profile domain-containing protein n=1 Tax=Elysia chlorotica TaxID=188477 RepID=A0A3S1BHC1_ELYCH|nr:hypothetical protein EGW08_008295 [Elysia chlorotica]